MTPQGRRQARQETGGFETGSYRAQRPYCAEQSVPRVLRGAALSCVIAGIVSGAFSGFAGLFSAVSFAVVHLVACLLLACVHGICALLRRHTLPRPSGCSRRCGQDSCARSTPACHRAGSKRA
jgi:hypothetical protein